MATERVDGESVARPRAKSSSDLVLDVSGLCVSYLGQRPVVAVDGLDLQLHRGEVLGVAGESGSGKSTVAHAITRVLTPPGIVTGGKVRYVNRDGEAYEILSLSTKELRRLRWAEIAIMFQAAMNALNPVISVRAQIIDVLRAHRTGMSSERREARVEELLDLVGISRDRARAFPHELSGGMRQRVVLAIALALDPEVIILDEPTTALDVVVQRQLLAKILELREVLGYSVIFITHDLSLLVELADRVSIMYAGRLVEEAPARSLYSRPAHPYSAGLLSSFPLLHGPRRLLAGVSGYPPDLAALPAGCAFHPRCRFAFDRCSAEVPVLLTRPGGQDGQVACWLHDQDGDPPDLLGALRAVRATPPPTASPGPEVMRANGVGKRFRVRGRTGRGRPTAQRSVRAVENVSFSLRAGAVTALVGESGSGKSTVGRLVARLLRPSEGSVELLGAATGHGRRAYARRVQMVLQDPFSSLNPTHTVGYHVGRAVRIHQHLRKRREVREEVNRLLGEVSLTPELSYAAAFPHELSGGQRQRVAIARALAARPSVLVTDEPVSMLDVSIRLGILNLLASLVRSREIALLYITHDIASARYFSSETLVMYAGELIEGGPSEEVTQRPAHPYTRLLVSCAPDPERQGGFTVTDAGGVPSLLAPPSGCRFHPRCPYAMDVCQKEAPVRSDLGGGRWARCWLFEGTAEGAPEEPLPATGWATSSDGSGRSASP